MRGVDWNGTWGEMMVGHKKGRKGSELAVAIVVKERIGDRGGGRRWNRDSRVCGRRIGRSQKKRKGIEAEDANEDWSD